MPYRASTSFLQARCDLYVIKFLLCQCPLGLLPHFYITITHSMARIQTCVNALSGCYLISTVETAVEVTIPLIIVCQCPLGLLPHFYFEDGCKIEVAITAVSMPSRAVTSFLRGLWRLRNPLNVLCQCPLGLLPHFYGVTKTP